MVSKPVPEFAKKAASSEKTSQRKKFLKHKNKIFLIIDGHYILYSTITTFISCLLWVSCSKSNVSDTNFPTKELTLVKEITLPFSEPSGIAFSDALQKMWIVSGGDQRIYRLDTNGVIEKRLPFIGVDLEGITFDATDSTLWVIDEYEANITHLDLDGSILLQKKLLYSFTPNKGPEGITIGKNHTIVVVNEKNPSVLFKLDNEYEIAQTYQLTFASDYSDISFNPSDNTFFILSDESSAFFKVNENIKVQEKYSLPNGKNEGIAYDEQRNVFYIVNDAENTLRWFKVK